MMARFRRLASHAAHEGWYPGFHHVLRTIQAAEWRTKAELDLRQRDILRSMITFAFAEVPYYREMSSRLGLRPEDIAAPADLAFLPILTRGEVVAAKESFHPQRRQCARYHEGATGGTAGTPMCYRLSAYDRAIMLATMYRGWGYAGFRQGDSTVVLAGRSLGVGRGKPSWERRLGDLARNVTKLSAFDMSEPALDSYIASINRVKPAFIRGYPGALQVLADRVIDRKATVWSPRGVFSTSENLLPQMRESIENAFGCRVFDGYGLNDGGVSAYECSSHHGLHIDTERSILQIVDEQGVPLTTGIGRIIATTLTNYAMPLLRYDTGDVGEIDADPVCTCGRPRILLKKVWGRTTDVLLTPEGAKVHGWFFLYMFWDLGKGIKEYQVVQETVRDISILLVVASDFNVAVIDEIRRVVSAQSPGWVVRIQVVASLRRTAGAKTKFIENKIL
ncbi:MAG: phenylacetate--CoA ligase family protein [Dehalococcoidia bacterium]|nr:phenylacetate--CoA ligase family protein [Dehalococcoidia bacterium]